LPEFLQAQGQAVVTPEALRAHLEANPAPFPKVKTTGGAHIRRELPEGYRVEPLAPRTGYPTGAAQRNYTLIGPDGVGRAFYADGADDAIDAALDMLDRRVGAPTKFHRYQVPGGEQYRETLLTLPYEKKGLGPLREGESLMEALEREQAAHPVFQHYHFPEDKNILVHTRANDRTLPTGERGRFVEEVQSDWHQKGEKAGYQTAISDTLPPNIQIRKNPYGNEWQAVRVNAGGYPIEDLTSWHPSPEAAELGARRILAGSESRVPDAPFKDTWPDLGYKQQLIEAANDPQAEWIGFTGGRTQANRYDLSKHISEVHYSGTNLKAYDLDGNVVIQQTGILPADLPDYIGKEAADKLLSQPKQGTLQSLTGLDLKMGGEGMEAFYDKKLPKRVEKIVKPYGGTVESVEVAGEPSWITRLTPDMKAAIKRGVPLMSILAAAVSAGLISQAEADQLKAQGYQ